MFNGYLLEVKGITSLGSSLLLLFSSCFPAAQFKVCHFFVLHFSELVTLEITDRQILL